MKRYNIGAIGSALAVVMLLLAGLPAAGAGGDEMKEEKFRELAQKYPDSPGRLSMAKARWLTERGNSHGQGGALDPAIADFREAIDIRRDYVPAYIALTLAYRAGERYDEALEVIEKMPSRMKLGDTELGGFQHDQYYLRMLVYAAIPDHEKGIAAAREGIRILNDPEIQEQRRRAENAGLAGAGSGSRIVSFLERYLKAQQPGRGD